MTACYIYQTLVGGAGINHDTLLYEMRWWQITSAVRGYNERNQSSHVMTRWQTWAILSALGAKISSPQELMTFPWEKAAADEQPTADEIQQLQEEMRRLNRNS